MIAVRARFLAVAWTIATLVAGQNVSPRCHGGGQCDEDGSSASANMLQVDNVKDMIMEELQTSNEEIVADSKTMVTEPGLLDSLGMRASANDTGEDRQAKELAISSVCNIYAVSERIKHFFIAADSDEDGALSKAELASTGHGDANDKDSDGDAAANTTKAQFLNATMHPLVQSLVGILEKSGSALAFRLSEGVRVVAEKLQEGLDPAEFLEICAISSAGEPATDEADEPQVSSLEVRAAGSSQAAPAVVAEQGDEDYRPRPPTPQGDHKAPPLACLAPSTVLASRNGNKALSTFRRGDSVGQYSARITAEGDVDVASEGKFHEGFMLGWAMRDTEEQATFLKFTTAGGRNAAVTEDHFLLVQGLSGGELRKASDVNVGDHLAYGDAFTNRTVAWDAIEKKEEVVEIGLLDPLFISHGGYEGDFVETDTGLLLPVYSGASEIGIDASAQHKIFHDWIRKIIPMAREHPCLFKELPRGLIIVGLMRAYLMVWKDLKVGQNENLQTQPPHELDSFESLLNASRVVIEASVPAEDLERHLAVCPDVAALAGVDAHPNVVRHMEPMRQVLESMGPQSDDDVQAVLQEMLAQPQE